MKNSLILMYVLSAALNASEEVSTLLVTMPELATNFGMLKEPQEGHVSDECGASIHAIDGSIISTFSDCDRSSSNDDCIFTCKKGEEELQYLNVGFYLLVWRTPTQMEIFESTTPFGRFEQSTVYSMNIYRTAQKNLVIKVQIDDLFTDTFSSCKESVGDYQDHDVEIYCVNSDGTDVMILGSKNNGTLVLTGMWNTPELADKATYFKGEILLEDFLR